MQFPRAELSWVMSGRRQLNTAQISQVIDETIWKEKIAHEKKAREYWDNIYRSDIMKDALPVRISIYTCKYCTPCYD